MKIEDLNDQFSENEIIGGLLNDNNSFTNVHDILRPDHFYSPEFGAIYGAFAATYRQGEPAGLMTIANLAGVAPHRLVEIMSETVMGAQRRSAQRIIELSQKRGILRALREISASLEELPIEELAGKITAIAVGISHDAVQKRVLDAD